MKKVLLFFLLICGQVSAEESNVSTFTHLLNNYEKALLLLEKYKDENRQLKNVIASYDSASNMKNKNYELNKDTFVKNSVDNLKNKKYIITHEYQNLRNSPSPKALILNVLKKGTEVKMLEGIKLPGEKYWLKVNYINTDGASIVGYLYY